MTKPTVPRMTRDTSVMWSFFNVIANRLRCTDEAGFLKPIDSNDTISPDKSVYYSTDLSDLVFKEGASVFSLTSGSSTSSNQVAISSADTTPDFLEDKIVAGSNVTLTKLNTGGNEQISIAATSSSATNEVAVSSGDTTPDFLENKLNAGTGITLTKLNAGGDEEIQIATTITDVKDVKVSSADTTAAFLESKIVAGSNVTINKLNTGGNEQLEIESTDTISNEVAISSADTTPDFLENKLSAGTGITLTKLNAGGDEEIQIATTVTDSFEVAVSSGDTTPAFLEDKIVAGSNITLTKLNAGGNEQISIASTGGGGGGITYATAIATTSGTSHNFPIPTGVNRVTMIGRNVSTNSANLVFVQVGTSLAIITTGYAGVVRQIGSGTATASIGSIFLDRVNTSAAANRQFRVVLQKLDGFLWSYTSECAHTNSGAYYINHGIVDVTDELRQIEINGNGGTFDTGLVNVCWET